MYMKKFKAESQRLLELMINSIYTNKEIFLRELISNASDAIDKLHFISLTDSNASRDFEIKLEIDDKARTITVIDNGIGMDENDLEENLGTIANSGTFKFKAENKTDEELIGQFGVGFYASFMVADKVTVISKKYGTDVAYKWESSGSDGYTITPSERDDCGTTIILNLKPDSEDNKTDEYLSEWRIGELVKKYSDYIRYPITMLCTSERKKEGTDEWEEYKEVRTLNSRLPIWKRNKSDVKQADYIDFYRTKYFDMTEPFHYFTAKTEGALTYNALIYVPGKAPYDYYTSDYKRGLSLYANGVLIMEKCEDLLPDYFGFLRGIVDSSDLSLNISREMLQKDRQLKALAAGINKRIISEFNKLMASDRETYEKIFLEYGASIKFGVYENFGAKKDELKDIILFRSSAGEKLISLKEYVSRMAPEQNEIYYASGKTLASIERMPQVEGMKAKGNEVLYLTDQIDEFVMKVLGEYDGKKIVPVGAAGEEVKDDNLKDLLTFMTEALDGKVKDVRLNSNIGSYPSCLTAEGEVSLEMERILNNMPTGKGIKATRIMEINPTHVIIDMAKDLFESDKDRLKKLTNILYGEALLLAGLDIGDSAEFVLSLNDMIS
ncbi:MAG: molecular chaperone HtpG [Clostridiales bacterium]|nr:molecular chaperone HtpG [Clostridiales bacterium]